MDPPVIVCGAPRSGTAMIRNLIGSHPDIVFSNEFPLERLPSVEPLFDEYARLFHQAPYRGDWAPRKAQLMRWLWFAGSSPARLEAGLSSRRFGNKTPWAELATDFYDDAFEVAPPRYVYTLREGGRVILSRLNMPWGRPPSIHRQLDRYKESVRAMERFRRRAGDRLFVVQLDRGLDTEADRLELARQLLDFLDEDVTQEVRSFVRRWPRVQPTSSVSGQDQVLTELPPDGQRVLDEDTEFQEMMATYGYRSDA